MIYRILFIFIFSTLLSSFVHCGGGVLDVGGAVQELVETFTEKYKVVVTNKMENSMYPKCASADDTIEGSGSDENGFWTVQPGEGFTPNNWGTTCFWCYANNNGQEARDSGNWYLHQDVWGWEGCDGPGNNEGVDGNDVTNWEIRDDGAYSNMCADCDGGASFEKYADWGPEP